MKAVNVDEVLKILFKYGQFVSVNQSMDYRKMQDEIANLPSVSDSTMLLKAKEEIKRASIDDYGMQQYTVDRCCEIIDNL